MMNPGRSDSAIRPGLATKGTKLTEGGELE